MKFEEWLKLVYINEEIPLRGGRSSHQGQILRILNAIKNKDYDKLISIKPIPCNVDTEIVGYCRYLQYCLTILKMRVEMG